LLSQPSIQRHLQGHPVGPFGPILAGPPACWPEAAFDANGVKSPGAAVPNWPNSDSGCPTVNSTFPTYYSAKQRASDEIRVIYTLYFAQDAFKPTGHHYDFENITVVWKLVSGQWVRYQLLLSQHQTHDTKAWANAESWSADETSAGKGREYPRIFVGFGSHAMYNNQNGLKDVLSAYTGLEHRGHDCPVDAKTLDLVEVTNDNDLALKLDAADFGGTTNPATRSRGLCPA
jgi:hypothetical protein